MPNGDDKIVVSGGGIGLGTILFIVFLILKLTGTITWSWWWVTAPLWIPFALILGILALALVILIIGRIFAVFLN